MTQQGANQTILIVESDQDLAKDLQALLEFISCNAVLVNSAQITDEVRRQGPFDAVILGNLDNHKPLSEIVPSFSRWDMGLPVILFDHSDEDFIQVQGTSKNVMALLQAPLRYPQLKETLRRAAEFRHRTSGNSRQPPGHAISLVGNSAAIQDIRRMIEQVAPTRANVLILGESGTGKEVVARKIHSLSNRCNKPFVPVNCGAIPTDLLESEMFGHEKGAFTGAISARQGRFELAEKGTLFLDEIGDMSLPMQVKLLRVIQERSFERVGSNKSINADVRILAATHRNLETRIKEGKFREDLFYRLNVFPMELPPLRERPEDIPYLVHDIIERLERENRGSIRLTAGAVERLCQYEWPGNVRELANMIERLAILCPSGIADVKDLPSKFLKGGQVTRIYQGENFSPAELPVDVWGRKDAFSEAEPIPGPVSADAGEDGIAASFSDTPELPEQGLDLKEHLAQLEIDLIKQALDAADGVVAHAAKLLKMRRTTLVEKLRKYGLQRPTEVT